MADIIVPVICEIILVIGGVLIAAVAIQVLA
jgi:hypothetical protein